MNLREFLAWWLRGLQALTEYVQDDNPGAVFGGDSWVMQLVEAAGAAIAKAEGRTL